MIIEAKDFATTRDNGLPFGCASREMVTTAFLKLAKAVADGRLILQSAEIRSKACVDDYMLTTVQFVYAESDSPLPNASIDTTKIKDLYGFDNLFPIAT